jgi:putative Ca2+/H+ antiporter (TMEM165/GDT1 family)
MYQGFMAFLVALGVVVLAEMGDKTQLLAMAFAAKYKIRNVFIGILLATVFNHGLAVAAGHFLMRFESLQRIIQGLASVSFIFFGLWTIRGDKLEGEETRTVKYGEIITVGAAFFIAEMGDKTQLATIALSAKFSASPMGVLMGTTTGMVIADGIGIIIGTVLRKKIPEQKIKFLSAGAFILFGLIETYQILQGDFHLPVYIVIGIILALIVLTLLAGRLILRKNRESVPAVPVSP